MTLKSRSPDIVTARAAPIEAAGGLPSSFDFKEEVLIDSGGPSGSRPMWSLESRVRRTGSARELTLADVAEIFPGTAGLGDPSTPVSSVGGIRIEQIEVELPAITFGSVAVRPSLIVWRDRDAGVVIAAEYAFTEKIADYWSQPGADVSAIRAYFAALQRGAADWTAPTPTKTAAVYAWATARAARGR
jgi:hypothetical protein